MGRLHEVNKENLTTVETSHAEAILADVDILEAPKKLAEFAEVDSLVDFLVRTIDVQFDGLWQDNTYELGVGVVGVEAYYRREERSRPSDQTCSLPEGNPANSFWGVVHGVVIDVNELLMMEGQLARCMMRCVYHEDRFALLKLWVSVAFALCGRLHLMGIIQILGQMKKRGLKGNEALPIHTSVPEFSIVGDDPTNLEFAWARVFLDLATFRSVDLNGWAYTIQPSFLEDEEGLELQRASMGHMRRDVDDMKSTFVKGRLRLKMEESSGKSRRPLDDVGGNARRGPSSRSKRGGSRIYETPPSSQGSSGSWSSTTRRYYYTEGRL